MDCLNCGQETSNSKFCSTHCSAIYNNKLYPKRKLKSFYCRKCKKLLGEGTNFRKRKYCQECYRTMKFCVDWSQITLAQFFKKLKRYQAHARIRQRARQIFHKENRPQQCSICRYNKHIEICHVKPIGSFPEDTAISIINDISNLIALCPNCHWELDNGVLKLGEEQVFNWVS